MKEKFTKQIAKQIAFEQFRWTIGGVLGSDDPDFTLYDNLDKVEYEFTEKLEEKNIVPTPKRVEVILAYYEVYVAKATKALEKLINKK